MLDKINQLMFKKYCNATVALPDHNPTADFEWIKHQSGLPWLRLDFAVPYQTILEEIQNIQSLMTEHREAYNEHQGWSSFCIHGKSYDATREDAYYNDDRPHIWTDQALELMPRTVEYFQTWPTNQFFRLRVMRLEPGGYVSVHRDSDQSKLSAINIAITQPDQCYFLMERHGVVPFEPGAAFWLDLSNRHMVFNNSDQPRWHLIVHQTSDNTDFHKLVVKSYNMLYTNSNEKSHNYNP